MENEMNPADVTRRPHKMLTLEILASIVIIIVLAVFVVYKMKHLSPATVQTMQDASIVQAVGKLMIIPNEQPIIATINQADVLTKEQAFYDGSQNGDKLLIFPTAQKAVIYSPTRNVIVNSGPFVVNSGTATTPTPTTSSQTTPVPTK